jgi:hypothetical protein
MLISNVSSKNGEKKSLPSSWRKKREGGAPDTGRRQFYGIFPKVISISPSNHIGGLLQI